MRGPIGHALGAVLACSLAAAGCGGSAASSSTRSAVRSSSASAPRTPTTPASAPRRPSCCQRPRAPFAVGIRTITLIDSSRTVSYPGGGPVPRKLVTVIRYPARGPATGTDELDAPPVTYAGPFPLVLFGHGFAVTPAPYGALLAAWARAGYVVAAPVFPLENASAPGGPNESDLPNQPRDMSFVITRLLAASAHRGDALSGLIDPRRVAVSGQSDGGETALAVAYDRFFLDRRVRAAMILSGAKIPGVGGFDFPAPAPPLLATQGTADTINPPSFTSAFFDVAPSPKYLLLLLGAPHLGPYTDQQPQLGIVERVTIAFLDRYLKGAPGALRRMLAAGEVPGLAALQSEP